MSLQVKNVSFTYMPGTPFERKALEDVSLEINKGEFVAIIGHTGSGKSTLAEHLCGLQHPSAGSVLLDGVNLADKTPEAKSSRFKVGLVFQYPEHQLFAETIYDDIAFGPRNLGKSEEEISAMVKSAMEFVDLDYEEFAQRSPFSLSGGQTRRVAIAGIIAMEPEYLIMDEPTAGLDPISRDSLFANLQKLYQKRKISIILITHSMEEAATYAQRLLVMNRGKLVIDGEPSVIFREKRELLDEIGVGVPEAVLTADVLRTHGLNLKEIPLTCGELVEAIKKAKGWR